MKTFYLFLKISEWVYEQLYIYDKCILPTKSMSNDLVLQLLVTVYYYYCKI